MKTTKHFILMALPVFAFTFACKKAEEPKETIQAVNSAVQLQETENRLNQSPPKAGGSVVDKKHTVTKGDTLMSLSRKYYGDPSKWDRIYKANTGTIKGPSLIHPGNKLVIPDITERTTSRPAPSTPGAKNPYIITGTAPLIKMPAKEAKKPYEKKETWFSLPNAAGGKVDLADYGGQAIMLMFFTETCPYCKKAAPFMERMSKTHKAGGLNVLGVSLNRDPAYASGFAKYFGLTFPLAYEGGPVARRYNAQGVPFIYLLKKDHTVYNIWAGYDEYMDEEIKSGIAEVLK